MNHLALHYEMPLLPVVKFPLDAQQIKRAYMAGNQRRQGMFSNTCRCMNNSFFSAFLSAFLQFVQCFYLHTSRLILLF